jgi:hypothetical protein
MISADTSVMPMAATFFDARAAMRAVEAMMARGYGASLMSRVGVGAGGV